MIFGINNDWFSIKRNLERFGYCWTYARKHGANRLIAHLHRQVFPLRSMSPRKMFFKGIHALQGGNWTLKRPRLIRLLKAADKVDIVLSFTGAGGAEDYLDNILRNKRDNTLALVARDAGYDGIKDYLQVETWRNGKTILRFIIHKLAFFSQLPPHKQYTIVINELVGWNRYTGETAMSEIGLAQIVDEIIAVQQALNARAIYLLHDYYCMCPRITITNDSGRYCGTEFTCTDCAACLSSDNAKVGSFALGTNIAKWRETNRRLLSRCAEIRAFSNDTLQRVKKCYPFDGVYTLVPHENADTLRKAHINATESPVIGVFGSLVPAKGRTEVLALAKYLLENNRTTKIIVVGQILDCPNPPPNITITGPYERKDLPRIVEERDINVAFFSSIWPETFSYVTQELMMLGLPVVCFNIGAQAERVSKYEYGRIAKSLSPADIWAAIQEAHSHFIKEAK